MVVDCSYGQPYVIDEAPPPGGDDISEDAVRRALTWLIDHMEEVDEEIVKVNFLNLSTVDFTTLATACPELAPLKKNLHGFRMLLEVCMHKLRDANNVTAINTQLVARFVDPEVCKQVLSYAYHDGNT